MTHSKPLLRSSVKAYWGEVIHADYSPDRLRADAAGVVVPSPNSDPSELGWARIMVHHQGDVDQGIAPSFEGAFSVNGNVHHVMTKDNYLRTKHSQDPDIAQPMDDTDSSLVIWRESDVMTPSEEHLARTGQPFRADSPAPQTCGHDSLPFNTDPNLNVVLQKPLSADWEDSLKRLGNATLLTRDDVVGDGMSTKCVFPRTRLFGKLINVSH